MDHTVNNTYDNRYSLDGNMSGVDKNLSSIDDTLDSIDNNNNNNIKKWYLYSAFLSAESALQC